MKQVYLFDIDGTLANVAHRLHHISEAFDDQGMKRKADWPAFYAACDQDAPIPHMIELALTLAVETDILFVTGRTDDVRDKTLAWLKAHFGDWISSPDIYMRPSGDYRADTVVKSELLDQVIADGWTPIMVFEDRSSVVSMWRERGIPCCQVAPGDF